MSVGEIKVAAGPVPEMTMVAVPAPMSLREAALTDRERLMEGIRGMDACWDRDIMVMLIEASAGDLHDRFTQGARQRETRRDLEAKLRSLEVKQRQAQYMADRADLEPGVRASARLIATRMQSRMADVRAKIAAMPRTSPGHEPPPVTDFGADDGRRLVLDEIGGKTPRNAPGSAGRGTHHQLSGHHVLYTTGGRSLHKGTIIEHLNRGEPEPRMGDYPGSEGGLHVMVHDHRTGELDEIPARHVRQIKKLGRANRIMSLRAAHADTRDSLDRRAIQRAIRHVAARVQPLRHGPHYRAAHRMGHTWEAEHERTREAAAGSELGAYRVSLRHRDGRHRAVKVNAVSGFHARSMVSKSLPHAHILNVARIREAGVMSGLHDAAELGLSEHPSARLITHELKKHAAAGHGPEHPRVRALQGMLKRLRST